MNKTIGIMVILCLVSLQSAQAGRFCIGPTLGYDVLTGSAGRRADDGVAYGLTAGYRLNATVDLEVAAAYSTHDDVVDDRGASTLNIWSCTIGPKVAFPWRDMRLYATAGVGIYPLDFKFEPEGTGLPARRDDDTESGIYGGIGIDMPLSATLRLGIGLTYHHIFNDNILDGDMIGTQVRLSYEGL